jgi:hypothetical protein
MNHKQNFLPALIIISLLPITAWGQITISPSALAGLPATEILEYQERVAESRLEGIDRYAKKFDMGGPESPGFAGLPSLWKVFEKKTITKPDGTTVNVMFELAPDEAMHLARQSDPDNVMTAQNLQAASEALLNTQAAFNSEITSSDMGGLLMGLMGVPGISGAGAGFGNPFTMLSDGSLFYAAAARAVSKSEESYAESQARAQAQFAEMAAAMENATVSREDYAGVAAIKLTLDEPGTSMGQQDGQEFFMNGANMWIDAANLVILGHRMEGEAVIDGQRRPVFMENINSDFREVPGSNLSEPYRSVMRMGGIMNAEQMAQMQQARQQLEEFDRQLAAMPASQRSMMESMMGSQMNMLRGLVNEGAFVYEEITSEIRINPDLASLYSGVELTTGQAPASGYSLVQQVQMDLKNLGYDPGNTNGEVTLETTIAISQFQAERGLAVDGEATPQLAGILAAAVESGR